MIKQLTGFPESVVAFSCRGHVTRADYDTVLVRASSTRCARTRRSGSTTTRPARTSRSMPTRLGKISKLEWSISRTGSALPS